MKFKNSRSLSFQAPQLFVALAGLVIGLSNTAQAVTLTKVNSTTLSAAADWSPAQVPTIADFLFWGSSPISAANNVSLSLGGDVSCLGMDLRDPLDNGNIRSLKIASGNTLTFGIGVSSFSQLRVINQANNQGMASVFDCAVNLTAPAVIDVQGSIVFNNSISQTGGNQALTKFNNAGAMHLNAANSYTGTTVNLGILTLGSSGTLGATTGNLTVGLADNNPAILDLGGTTQTVAAANFNRAYVLNGTVVASTYGSPTGLVSANLQGASAPLTAGDQRGLVLSGTNTYGGTTTISNGWLRATQPAALPNSGASGTFTINNASGFLAVRAGAASGEWDSTAIGGLLANPAFTVTAAGGALGIDTTGGDFSYASVIPATANLGLRKLGPNTLTLSAANLYPSSTTITRGSLKIDAGAGGSLAATSALAFAGTGALNFDNTTAAGATSQTLGALTASAGEATVQLTRTAAQTTDLKFASLATRTAGASRNFVVAGTPGVNGTDSKIWFTTPPTVSTFIDQGSFFGGSGYAINDSGNYLRAMNYATDTDGASVGSSFTDFTTAAVNGKHVDLGTAGSISAGITESIKSLRIGGTNGVTLTGGSTLTLASGGILKTGGGTSTITGGTGLSAAGSPLTDLVIRTDGSTDNLVINSPILLNTVTKSGAGTLELNGANTFTQLRLNAGKLNLKSATAFPNSGFTLVINEGTTLDNTSGGSMTVGNGAATVQIRGSFTYAGSSDLTLANGNGTFNSMPNDVTINVVANTLRMEKELTNGNYSTASLTKSGAGTFFFGGNGTMRFGGGLIINNGVITGTNQQGQNVAGVGPVTLGDTSGTNSATLWIQNGVDNSNPVTARAGSSGTLALVNTGNSRWTGPVTLNNALTLATINNSGNIFSMYGVISGAGNLNIGNSGSITVSSVASSLANVGTVRLMRENTYTGNTLVNSGSLRLGALAKIDSSPLISLAAGTTLDVSDIAAYTLSGTNTLAAKGTGTTLGTTQATVKGATGGAVSLSNRPVSLTFTPTSGSGDTTHPSLVISQGSLTLSGNTISVINNGPALGAGVYRLIQTPGAITGVPNTALVNVTGSGGLAANSEAIATVSGNDVILTVSTKLVASFTGLTLSQTIQAGTANVTLSGTVEAPGPVYPADGETVHVTINGVTNNTTTSGGTGSFSIVFPTSTLPGSPGAGISYPITYTYDTSATLTAATNAATALTVTTQTVPTINSWPTTAGLIYGQDLTNATLTGGSASVPGTFTYMFPSTIPGAAGTYLASGKFTPNNTGTYSTVIVPAVISVPVSQKELTIASPAVTTRAYNAGLDATITGTLTGVLAGDVGLVTLVGTGLFDTATPAAGIPVDASSSTLAGAQSGNYFLTVPFGLTGEITAATLTVKADDKGRPTGVANPTLTSAVIGYQGADDATSVGLTGTPVLATSATPASPAGSYPITCAAGDVAITDPNYTLAFAPGTLNVIGLRTWAKGSQTWDINTSVNWTDPTISPATYVDGGAVLFPDTTGFGAGPFTVTLNTTVIPASVTMNNPTKDYTISGAGSIAGAGSLTKQGAGALTLNTANTYSGGTTVDACTLTLAKQTGFGTGPVALAAGTTFQQSDFEGNQVSGALPNAFALSGTGNVIMNMPFSQKDVWLSQQVTGTGGFTVQGGSRKLTLTGNNSFSGGVTLQNFDNTIQISHVNALGSGTFRSERIAANSGQLIPLTNLATGTGVPNAFDIASGAYLNVNTQGDGGTVNLLLSGPISSAVGTGNLNKNGAGTLTLGGPNTYSGNTTVNAGTLNLAAGAQLKFVLGATSGASNSISGAGTVVLDGNILIETTAANALTSGTWTLENVPSLSGVYGASFTVVGYTANIDNDTWTKTASGKTWTFVESTGVLTLTSGSDYNTWAAVYLPADVSNPAADNDGDGLTNQEEYAFGLNPTLGTSVNPITVPLNKTTGMFTYTRRATPAATGLTYSVQTSTDLAIWPMDVTATQTVTGTVGDVQTVDVTLSGTIPLTAPSIFVRIKAAP